MKLKDYIAQAKRELDDFEKDYRKGIQIDPENWPDDLDEGEWGDQEMASRFT